MQYNTHQILKQHWGFDVFRPMQENIINSILAGNDTLALLPTGGGKSICFQVPAMCLQGVCIVVTPLIALMKDQVENLQKKNINAIAIFSGMNYLEIDTALDNCVFNPNIKFLYLSPERLKTEIVIERIKRMNVSLLVVDEAHCISQWGYDFRPSYLEIANIREYIPKVPIIALTATATKQVAADIQEKLQFKQTNVFVKSFERKNLIYYSIYEDNKLNRLLTICQKFKGTGLVYVRNRKLTEETAKYLKSFNISADYYHAGLDQNVRDTKQQNWKNNRTRIIVCTNAFGMGIDKPDVRFVVHISLPDSIEAYFQEAGRAGRDEQLAHAIILYDDSDKETATDSHNLNFPEIQKVKILYQALANYLQLAVGSGLDAMFEFSLETFAQQYNMSPTLVYSCLQILEREALIIYNKEKTLPTRLKILYNNLEYYNFQVKNPKYEDMLKTIMRSYTELFENYVTINEYDIAKRAKKKVEEVIKNLKELTNIKVLSYIPQTKATQIIFTAPRVDVNQLTLKAQNYTWRKQQSEQRLTKLIDYVYNNIVCRSISLLNYFDDEGTNCGHCDVCIQRNKTQLSDSDYQIIKTEIAAYLNIKPHTINFLIDHTGSYNKEKIMHTIQLMLDEKQINYNAEMLLEMKV